MKTIDQIIKQSEEIFKKSGIASTTTNHIADHMEVSPAKIYYYFKNKEEILLKIQSNIAGEYNIFQKKDISELSPSENLTLLFHTLYFIKHRYSFFYCEISYILRNFNSVRDDYVRSKKSITKKIGKFFKSICMEMPQPEINRLVDIHWHIQETWLEYNSVNGKPVTPSVIIKGINASMTVIQPFLQDAIKGEFNAFLNQRKKGKP